MNWADLLVIGIILMIALRGYIQGLVVTVIRIVKLIGSLILANIFHKPFTNMIINVFGNPEEKITPAVNKFLSGFFGLSGAEAGAQAVTNTQMTQMMDSMKLSDSIQSTLQSEMSRKIFTTTSEFLNVLAKYIANYIIYALGFIALFIIFLLIFSILEKTTKIFTKLPVIRVFDRIGGALLGSIQGILIVMILIFIAGTFRSVEFLGRFMEAVQSSVFAKHFVNFNFVFGMIDFVATKVQSFN